MESGRIRRLAIHGDTKLDNFLFSTRTGRVKALVDLDTIMPHTWLADWGDMVRSLVNVAGEKERDLSRVQVDMDVYRAVARGFLSTAREVTPAEVDLMADAAADHRPRAGPAVPHWTTCAATATSSSGPPIRPTSTGRGPWRSSRSSAGSASARTKPGGSSRTCSAEFGA